MKLFGKLLIAVLIIGLLLPFTILKGKDGKPLMSFSGLKMPDLVMPELPSAEMPEIGGSKNVIYEWKDGKGNIQFTNSPPPQGVEFTAKGYDPDTNVIQSVGLSEDKTEAGEENKAGNSQTAEPNGLASVYSPEKINKLIDDAKNVEKLLNDRLKQQEAIIGD